MTYWQCFKSRFLLYLAAYLIKGLLRILLFTCRIEVRGLDKFIKAAEQERCILMLWHNRLGILPEILRHNAPQFIYRACISKSRDGELLAILAKSYSSGRTLRVPHNARHYALTQMIHQLRKTNEIFILTPDGPRGPQYKIKSGIILAAKQASANIIPFTWSVSHFWQLNTWDQLILPKPFSRIVAIFDDPIRLNEKKEFQNDKIYLQEVLLKLDETAHRGITSESEKWPK